MSLLNGKYALLARREFWEHRSLWLAPAIVGAAVLLLTLLGGGIHLGQGNGPTINVDGQQVPMLPNMFGKAAMVGVMGVLGGVTLLVMFAYLLDCLYGERKDRSILFWKSLPVSDAESVVAKLAVAIVLTPLALYAIALIVHPLLLGVLSLRFETMRMAIGFDSVVGGWQMLPLYLMVWVWGVLWYLPGVAWLMLASVLAKRAPLIYALMPPLVLILIEGMLLQGSSVARFLGGWLAPWSVDNLNWNFNTERGVIPGVMSLDWVRIFTQPQLWVGVALGAAMIYGVIRLRRYRDDT